MIGLRMHPGNGALDLLHTLLCIAGEGWRSEHFPLAADTFIGAVGIPETRRILMLV